VNGPLVIVAAIGPGVPAIVTVTTGEVVHPAAAVVTDHSSRVMLIRQGDELHRIRLRGSG
jgi:hypothetical protein